MKICPLCKIKYHDSANFCRNCKAELENYEDAQKSENSKIPRSFWLSLAAACAFIGLMYLFYYLVYSKIFV